MIGADGAASVRNQRFGVGNGRVYAVSFTATDGRGGSCQGVATVCIPHDRREVSSCTDDGQNFNSLGPCNGAPSRDPVASPAFDIMGSAPGRTEFAFHLDRECDVEMAIFDVSGRRVAVVDQGRHGPGDSRAVWVAGQVPPGVYLARGRFGGRIETRPVVVIR